MNSKAQSSSWHVAFEGPIASGKTTLTKLLADATGALTLLESFETNEFLADFYADQVRWALAMQLSFLLSRHHQFTTCGSSNARFVADHTFAKDRLFARLLLNGRELALYERVCDTIGVPSAHPNLIVFLDAPDDVLLERIRLRARPYEQSISAKQLQELRSAYERELLTTASAGVMRIDTAEVDLEDDGALRVLCDNIVSSIPQKAAQLKP
jgi:deoxyguanosine kinase